MIPIDEQVAGAVRAALGFRPGEEPADLAAAAAVNAASAATIMDGGSVVLLASWLTCRVRHDPGGPTAEAAHAALAGAWPLSTHRDLANLAAALLVSFAAVVTDEQLSDMAWYGAGLP
jgi:hypothetical protein